MDTLSVIELLFGLAVQKPCELDPPSEEPFDPTDYGPPSEVQLKFMKEAEEKLDKKPKRMRTELPAVPAELDPRFKPPNEKQLEDMIE